ncbi:transketolase [Dethiosulfatibacter aminovorans DSM 17477]|uniref:Transketolase n=1 Tax=Dethiosulfatibacter aminovorans DSM 17477 TaxID=1121476 RepID=A0A1M6E8A6_9FIRM|nr:transketolase [Dethiosulfatibacter aminovorans DSM 17477]
MEKEEKVLNSLQLAWKIRRHGIEMTHVSGGAHIGSILSVADIIGVLYNDIAKVDPNNPHMEDRDRIILSKGHAGAAIYAALAEKGFFDTKKLITHYANGSMLSGHVSHIGIPGVEFSTGSLGHGLPVAVGMALAAKKDNKKHRIFVILGDGECNEGAVWEAAMFSNHYKLDNLIAVIDHNKISGIGFCKDSMQICPFREKWEAFGWNVMDIDGHDHDALRNAYKSAVASLGKPSVIIANTTKGKGISYMENEISWHYRFPKEGEEYDTAVAELHAQMPDGTEDMYDVNVMEGEIL